MTKEVKVILDLIFAHSKSHIRRFLGNIGQPKSGNEVELYERIVNLVKAKLITEIELTELLDKIEGWGDQQIYLYKPLLREHRKIFEKKNFEELLKEHKMGKLLNGERSVVLSDKRTLSVIEYEENEFVKFIWIEKRIWEEREIDKDKISGEYIYKAYKTHTQRGIMTYDLNLKTGASMLMIQKLPTNSTKDYWKTKSELEEELKRFFQLDEIPSLQFKRGIKKIQKSGEVRSRQVEDKTPLGSRAKFTSSNRKIDVDKDITIKKARSVTSANSQPYMGNFYWLPELADGNLETELHTILYTSDNRLGIYGERTEEEVRYIIERIREFSQ